ncbi:hypothetical protein GNZ12_37810 [Paraburkholderia sp. 1N]|uniref:Uncharacterized protein n=1 Tax=Paraburkholderia solitsugae TaxID=2675748 RepID=A0ABX2C3R8_9BURK|nr:hypothetical protein [Paraburkholderia solitsugae]NPT46963.1 hypothetical protein [Paraburkholderia solitsugae]
MERFAHFYRTKSAHPRLVGESIVDAVQSGKCVVLVGPAARSICNLRRMSRSLLMKVMIVESKQIWT